MKFFAEHTITFVRKGTGETAKARFVVLHNANRVPNIGERIVAPVFLDGRIFIWSTNIASGEGLNRIADIESGHAPKESGDFSLTAMSWRPTVLDTTVIVRGTIETNSRPSEEAAAFVNAMNVHLKAGADKNVRGVEIVSP